METSSLTSTAAQTGCDSEPQTGRADYGMALSRFFKHLSLTSSAAPPLLLRCSRHSGGASTSLLQRGATTWRARTTPSSAPGRDPQTLSGRRSQGVLFTFGMCKGEYGGSDASLVLISSRSQTFVLGTQIFKMTIHHNTTHKRPDL